MKFTVAVALISLAVFVQSESEAVMEKQSETQLQDPVAHAPAWWNRWNKWNQANRPGQRGRPNRTGQVGSGNTIDSAKSKEFFTRMNNICGAKISPKKKVYGGHEVVHGDHPYVARITYDSRTICAGALVSDRHVVTAGHCDRPGNLQRLKVILGDHHMDVLEGTEQERGVVFVDVHPQYQPYPLYFDVSVFHLSQPVSFTDFVVPICLPDSRNYTQCSSCAWATGWGSTEHVYISKTLQEVLMSYMPTDVCRYNSRYSPSSILDTMVCAGDNGKDTCYGDSGGPLIMSRDYRWCLAGVVSAGFHTCGRDGYPGIFTNIPMVEHWIREAMASRL